MQKIEEIFTGAIWHNKYNNDEVILFIKLDGTAFCYSENLNIEKISKELLLQELIDKNYYYKKSLIKK